jgi:Transposase and inactivated derivatives
MPIILWVEGATEIHGSPMLKAITHLLAYFLRLIRSSFRKSPRIRRCAVRKSGYRRNNRKPEWVIQRVIRYKALMPQAGARTIALTFNRIHAAKGETVGKSFVAYTLQREAYRVAEMRRAIRRKQATAGKTNCVWALDLTGMQSLDGTMNSILGVIDHGSRRLLNLTVLRRYYAWTMLGHIFLAIGKYGKPRAIRTDNGSVFTARIFRAGLHLAGITHQRTDLHCPWQNGRIERLFGTLKQKLRQIEIETPDILSKAMPQFSFWYNTVRPHQNLGGRTPLEAWNNIDPYAKTPRHVIRHSAWDGVLTGYLHRQ